jgi:glyoxylase-like metal-dependent hydrolase (beta-lactamase superfamily II)
MDVQELTPELWRWSTRHPDWTEEEGGDDGWDPDVWSVYLEAPDAVVLIDPLVPQEPEERERFLRELDADVERVGLPVRVLITVYWHERSSRELADRYGGEIWAYREALPHLDARVERPFELGDPLPGGLHAFPAHRRAEMLYWLPREHALVVGDVFLGGEDRVRVCPDSWLPAGTSPADFRASLRPLLELPVALLLPAHGAPVLEGARAALARALAG